MPVFKMIQVPYCKMIVTDPWNSPAHRYFIGVRLRGTFRHILGLPVISEFSTFSSPIFFAPAALLGKVYNAGITLGHLRDPEMAIDTGWPPLCIGTGERVNGDVPANYEEAVIEALKAGESPLSLKGLTRFEMFSKQVDEFTVQFAQLESVTVFATDAPLSPRQLNRLAHYSNSELSIAFSTGNRITQPAKGTPLSIQVVSESYFDKLLMAFERTTPA